MMRLVVIAELAAALVLSVVFIVLYWLNADWKSSPVGRHIMAWMVVTVAETGSLLSLAVWPVPAWLFALVFAGVDAVVLQRIWLLRRMQRRE